MEETAKILVVDDEEEICQNVQKILSKNNYEVTHASSAQEALKKMADGQATKMFLPYEASGILSSLAGIGEMMKDGAIHASADADDAT